MDPYFKKEIEYELKGDKYKFDIGNTLFSTYDLDDGTDLLLRTMVYSEPKAILDIGCGYGPIGTILGKKNPEAAVTLLDKDLQAVRYASLNLAKNGVKNAKVLGSVGLEAIGEEKFDLIVSNIPAKIGDEAIVQEFLLKPYDHLTPDGEYWFVVVSALKRLIPKAAAEHNLKVREIKTRHSYAVYCLKKSDSRLLRIL